MKQRQTHFDGEVSKIRRITKKQTQAQQAAELGVSQRAISVWELGQRRPSDEMARKLLGEDE
jgi:transcriptional regulator with XRE-family HTH domain